VILLVLLPRAQARQEVTASLQSIELKGEWRFREAASGTWHPVRDFRDRLTIITLSDMYIKQE